MTPQELAGHALRALVAEISEARERLSELAAEIGIADPGPAADPDRKTMALLALDLHAYYCTFEALAERLAAAFEGTVPRGAASHVALLRQVGRPLTEVRPALYAAERFDALDELRRFRHAVRHASSLDLRWEKLRRALDPFMTTHPGLHEDLRAFEGFVRAMIAEVDG